MGKAKLNKNKNALSILDIIREHSKISRVSLAKLTEQTPASITKITKKLISEAYIVEEGFLDSTGGRPAKLLTLSPSIGNIISLYFAPDYLEVVLYSINMKILYREKSQIWINTKEKISEIALKLIERARKVSTSKILGIGIAVNGLVDSKNGVSLYSPHYKWNNFNIKSFFEKATGFDVYIENDVRIMAIGEKKYGFGKDMENFILINIGNGVGSALYLNNNIYTGSHFGAGEFGHIPVEDCHTRCKCGKVGCLETLISNTSLEENHLSKSLTNLNAREIYENYQKSEKGSIEIVEELGKNLVKGLIPLVNIINPSSIIINGDINRAGKKFLNFLQEELNKKSFGNNNKLELFFSTNEELIVHMGCAELILSNLFKK